MDGDVGLLYPIYKVALFWLFDCWEPSVLNSYICS